MGSQQPDDENDPPELPAEWVWPTIPDDASELAAEAAAVRAELADERRRHSDTRKAPVVRRHPTPRRRGDSGGWRYATEYGDLLPPAGRRSGEPDPSYDVHWSGTGRPERVRISRPLVMLLVLMLMATASMVALALPPETRSTPAEPTGPTGPTGSTKPTGPPLGRVGGLVPDVRLTTRGGPVAIRGIRPAVLLLLPDSCRCASVALDYLSAIGTTGPRLVLVGGNNQPTIPLGIAAERVLAGTDSAGRLAAGVGVLAGTDRPTAVLVRANGTIEQVVPNADKTPLSRAHLAHLTN